MKVLLAFPVKDKQTGLYIQNSFNRLGHEVLVCDAKTEPGNLFKKCKSFDPELIFCSRTPALLGGLKQCKNWNPKIKTTCWNVDKRNSVKEFGGGMLQLFNFVDIFYTTSLGNIKEYEQCCPNTIVKHLQQGCDPEVHKTEKLTEEDIKKYSCDVAFAGSFHYHNGRKQLLDFLRKKGIDLKVHTNVFDSEHNKSCQCAKIVLSHNGWPNIAISSSVRVYKVMAAGGFLLEQHCIDIDKWFDIGKECVTYNTNEDCLTKIKYYLEHEDERKQIALEGQKSAHEKHKYIDRIKQVYKDFE